ncbi:MAG: hypothetical protein JW997_00930 [Actinobacteria bacterium]|nr:hypothetical protein [Actinomycetota bacterium]
MAKTKVEAGICGFVTEIEAISEDMKHVSFRVNTDCEKIKNLSEKLGSFDAYNEIKDGFDGQLFKVIKAELTGCCSGCAASVRLFKSIQVAAVVALPKNIYITITK